LEHPCESERAPAYPRRTFTGVARELTEPAELEQAREALCETVNLFDYGECDLHLREVPTRAKIKELP
jgi:hypothetical protein